MSARARVIQSSLAAGELSGDLRGRSDLEAYFQGAEVLTNFFAKVTGGAQKRGGLALVGEVSDSSVRHRLIAFRFGRDQAFVIELDHLEARIRRRDTGAYQEDSGASVIVLTTPWESGDLAGLTWFQSGDVIYFGHQDRDQPWKTIRRNADDDWSIHDFAFREGPFLGENVNSNTISASNITGSVTLTASAATFDVSDHVGALFYMRPVTPSLSADLWQENTAYTVNDEVSYGGRVYKCASSSTSGYYAPIHDEGRAFDGGVQWDYQNDGLGMAEITAVATTTSATATVTRQLFQTAATSHWAEGAVSPFRGYPACGVIDQERLWCFNTVSQPDTAFASRSGDYDPDGAGFRPETAFGVVSNGDGFSATIADGEVNPIHAALSADRLYVFSEGAVKRISGPTQDEVITANDKIVREVSNVGARKGVSPIKADNAVLYVRADGQGLQEMPYGDGEHRDLLTRARQAAASPIAEMVGALYPDRRVYVRRDDGLVYVLVYSRGENMVSWSPVLPGGSFDGGAPVCESLCVIPGDDGADELWMIIKRTVDGATIRTVERLRRPFDVGLDRPDQQKYLDAHIVVDGWNTDTGKTMTLTLDDVANSQPGDTGVVTVGGHTPFSAPQVGDQIFLRSTSAPVRAGDIAGPLVVEITGFTSSSEVDVELVTSAPAGLTATTLDEWAFADDAVSGLDHLEGEAIYALADGEVMGPLTVSSGAVTLSRPAARVCAGLQMSARIVSMPVEAGSEIGSGRGAVSVIESLTVMLKDTIGGAIGVLGMDQKEDIAVRGGADVLGRAPIPRTEDIRVSPDSDHERSMQVELLHDTPTACTVLGIVAEVTVNA